LIRRTKVLRLRLIAILIFALAVSVRAHPTPFSNINLNVTEAGVDATVIAYAFDFAAQMGLASEVQAFDPALVGAQQEKIAAFVAERLEIYLDGQRLTAAPIGVAWSAGSATTLGRAATVRLAFARAGAPASTIRVVARFFPYDPLHESFLSVKRDGTLAGEAILTWQQPAAQLALDGSQSRLEVVKRFTRSGMEHIAIGPDHVLFLVGLLLLGGTFWQLVRIVTAFTLAHSVTLTLAALDIFSPPARVIEPLIALSICAVGLSNLAPRSSKTRDIRAWMAFAFGFIHGFGFAYVLRDLELPRAALGWSLFAFNLGVEIGQLAIVLVVAGLLAWVARRTPILHRRIGVAGSLVVLWAGFFWLVQRLFFA
jgi:hypothetical protein